jgi:hypothetical protein
LMNLQTNFMGLCLASEDWRTPHCHCHERVESATLSDQAFLHPWRDV